MPSRSTGLTDAQRTLLTVISVSLTALSVNILAFSEEIPRGVIIALTLAGGIAPIVREYYGVASAATADRVNGSGGEPRPPGRDVPPDL